MDSEYGRASDWLGILTAGLKWYDLVKYDFSEKCLELCKDISQQSQSSIENVINLNSQYQQLTWFNNHFKGRVFMWTSPAWQHSIHFDAFDNCYRVFDYDHPGNKRRGVYGTGKNLFTTVKVVGPTSISFELPRPEPGLCSENSSSWVVVMGWLVALLGS